MTPRRPNVPASIDTVVVSEGVARCLMRLAGWCQPAAYGVKARQRHGRLD
jgi:hypothetical protein